jgi:hypothetical protein
VLLLKLALVPAFILLISLAGQRWGPAVAGWLSGLPVVAGPILFFMALEQGAAFAAEAAVATASAVCGSLAFSLGYCWSAIRQAWPVCLAVAIVCYSAATLLLAIFEPALPASLTVALLAIVIAPRLFPRLSLDLLPPAMPRSELFIRMAAGAIMVVVATAAAASLGARLSGLVAMFPILGTVLAVFSHRHAGAAFTTHLLRGMAAGFYAFITFCGVLALMLPGHGIAAAFCVAIAAALSVQIAARWVLLRKRD